MEWNGEGERGRVYWIWGSTSAMLIEYGQVAYITLTSPMKWKPNSPSRGTERERGKGKGKGSTKQGGTGQTRYKDRHKMLFMGTCAACTSGGGNKSSGPKNGQVTRSRLVGSAIRK